MSASSSSSSSSSSGSSSAGGVFWSRKCTCAVETESDSDSDGESPTAVVTAPTSAAEAKAQALSLGRMPRRASGVRDPIKTSHALHNSEALRQAHALQNVFCACYESDTVLALVAKRERVLSPVQAMLLAPENVAQVFAYATSFPGGAGDISSSHRKASARQVLDSAAEDKTLSEREPLNPLADPDKYRRPYIATEIIVRFYLKVMTWHGSPKVLLSPSPAALQEEHGASSRSNSSGSENEHEGEPSPAAQTGDRRSLGAIPEAKKPSTPAKHFLLDFSGFHHASLGKLALGRASSGSVASSSRFSDMSEASASVRGYILHIEDLTLVEWKRIFSSMYRFLWHPLPSAVRPNVAGYAVSAGEQRTSNNAAGVDSILLANMCRVTKNFAVYPSVHAILSTIDVPGGETLFARLAHHAYNPEVSSLLHGLVHLARGRQYPFQPIFRSLVREIIDVPYELPSTSASLLTPKYNLRDALVHARISGCADVLVKVLTQQFPNTFSYYIQQKLQLASFESVESFEREIFPPKVLPNDKSLHEQIKEGVMAALLETPYIVMRLAEIGVAEIRYLDANHSERVGIPTVLVLDVLKCAIDLSVFDKDRMKLLVPPVQLVVETLCAAINYHQHISTISEFASRDCFSDSDSEDSQEDDEDMLSYDVSKSDKLQNHFGHQPRHHHATASPPAAPSSEVARRQLRESVIDPPATCISPTSGKRVVNHRPLASALLVVHVVEFMDAVIRMGKGSVDAQLAKFDLAMSLLDIFEKFPKANILHCRIVKLYLNLFDRVAPNGRVNNPLLRSVFRPPDSILDFILRKLHQSAGTHPYDAHLAILGVKIDKICSAPRLEQELIRQYCSSMVGWTEFSSSLVASHYQQIDALDDAVLGISSLSNGTAHRGARGRSDSDGADDVFPLARPTSSGTSFLSQELEPFRRLPMEKEGFGSPLNLASGTEAVNPTDMFRSRSQSQYPQSIIDVLKADSATSFDAVEDDESISGFVYQKRSKWVKVHMRFEKESCLLILEDAGANGSIQRSPAKPKSTSKLKQFLMAKTHHWTSRQRKLVVCNARQWIAFGRSVKNPGIGAFGFQVETFDRSREVDETLTFVTRSDAMRTMWYEGMQHAMTTSQALRNSITEEDSEANIVLVKCVATKREHHQMLYYVVPNVHLLGPVLAPTFFLKSEVPEELPFWGTFHGVHGITQYVSLLNRCVRVLSVEEKRMYSSGYSVIVEFDATFQRVEPAELERKMPAPRTPGAKAAVVDDPNSVTCSCTDTYLVTGNQIIGLTRTIADSEKLMQILSDYE